MDKDTRNAIERATQRARKLIEEDFSAQLEGTFDVLREGTVAPKAGSHLSPRQVFQRDKIVAAIEHKRAAGMTAAEAVKDYLRDAAFTTLNRFVALKMLEARELIQECVTKGEQSVGYREFCGMAPGIGLLPESAGYRLYIESLFDELSTEIKVLFDRRDAASVLWPKRQTFDDLLGLLNAAELANVWNEDETIGWVYQYFNSRADIDRARYTEDGKSKSPQNSRELAVRNQFFTPRYVVQFLTDNTLGRIWLQMRGGKSTLAQGCDYFVPDDEAVAPRAKKDPRDIKVLDPACGSGHFLLYAFALLLVMYEEAWEDETANIRSEVTGRSLREDYPDLATLRCAIPALIVQHNLYGVDIDPRAAQIAALALWLRAQRAYRDFGLPRSKWTPITYTHIVVAEPMPGDLAMLDTFAANLEPPLLRDLFKKIVGEMRLAGELGTLLRVEEGIATELTRAREEFVKQHQTLRYLPGMEPVRKQSELNLSGIDDAQFFQEAEAHIDESLRRFAESAAGGVGVRRRLFAGDAAQGIALIDLLQNRFDVVLMNPPFGAPLMQLDGPYEQSKEDIDAAFVTRAIKLVGVGGRVGALVNRTQFTKSTLKDWRKACLIGRWHISVCADLGLGVLDGALVETAAYCLDGSAATQCSTFFRLMRSRDRAADLRGSIERLSAETSGAVIHVSPESFASFPAARIAYWISPALRDAFVKLDRLEGHLGTARQGTITSDNFRFLRLAWEIAEDQIGHSIDDTFKGKPWVFFAKGGEYSPYFQDLHLVVRWEKDGYEIKNVVDANGIQRSRPQGLEWNFRRALTYSERTASNLSVRVCPPGCFYSQVGPVIATMNQESVRPLLAVLMSRVVAYVIELSAESVGAVTRGGAARHYTQGIVGGLPIPELKGKPGLDLDVLVEQVWQGFAAEEQSRETSRYFVTPLAELITRRVSSLLRLAQVCYEATEQRYLKIIETTWKIETIVRDLYKIDSLAGAEIDEEVGRHPGSYVDERLFDDAFDGLWQGPLDDIIARIVDREGASRSATKMCFFADRRLELLAHYYRTSPRCVAEARRSRGVLPEGYILSKAEDVLSYMIGIAFDRWSTKPVGSDGENRLSDMSPVPSIPPACIRDRRTVARILVDDEGHPNDIVAAVAKAASLFGVESLPQIIDESVAVLLGRTAEMRDWIRLQCFDRHLRRYSESRRKAPIYWQLATPSSSYSVWLYLHAFNGDTIYQVQNEFVGPKVDHEEHRLESLRNEFGPDPNAAQRKKLATQESYVDELRTLLDEVKRVAPLWNPNLDDGVIINFSLLWRLVPHYKPWQKELKATWDALCTGDYDWSHLAMHLWSERVVPKCASDRSLAIAHGLEDVFWIEGAEGKWKARTTPLKSVEELVRERSSPAVKAALKSQLEAPTVSGNGRGRGRQRAASAATTVGGNR